MTTIHARATSVTAAVGAAIASLAAPALLFLGAGTVEALPDLSERGGILHDLPTPRDCGGCDGFNPQPDPPGYPDSGVRPPLIGDLGLHPGSQGGLGGPDTTGGIIIIGG
jgi:hypothetical protein